VTYLAEIAPGNCSGRHTHPSIETSYVIEGTMLVMVAGKPDQTFKAGASKPRRLCSVWCAALTSPC
jgi:quercetin dioxygenase-like cupin family protein